MATVTKKELTKRAQKIKVLLLDVDGVLTDGLVHILQDGNEFYTFNVYDGYGIKVWQRAGFKTGFITGRNAVPVRERAHALGVEYLFQNAGDKLSLAEEVARKEAISFDEIAFMGDDIQDLPLLKKAGLAITVPNAQNEVIKEAHYITKRAGGDGAVRQAVKVLMKAKGLWRDVVADERILS